MPKSNDQICITVRVTPGAKRNSIISHKEGVWYIKIAAPPVEGRANEELISYISRVLDIRKSAVAVLKGQSSRIKVLAITGLSQADIEKRLYAEMSR
jgi:uncharacterized protein (TIGR00251 family)